MTRTGSNTKTNYPVLRCPNKRCDNISAPLLLIENKIIKSLSEWLENYELNWPKEDLNKEISGISYKEAAYKAILSTCEQIEKQISNTYDLLEQGIYDIETFQERRRLLEEKKASLNSELVKCKREYEDAVSINNARTNYIPKVKSIVSVYWTLDDVATKNELLKSILAKVYYLKTERNKKGKGDTANFTLNLYPKIPKRL